MEDTIIKTFENEQKLVEHKVLFTFECEELGKNYIAYEGNKQNEIVVASYNPNNDLNKLEPITEVEELKMVEDVLNQIIVE